MPLGLEASEVGVVKKNLSPPGWDKLLCRVGRGRTMGNEIL